MCAINEAHTVCAINEVHTVCAVNEARTVSTGVLPQRGAHSARRQRGAHTVHPIKYPINTEACTECSHKARTVCTIYKACTEVATTQVHTDRGVH